MSQELTSTLHSTLYDVQIAYVDEMIVFTCVVRGSDIMAWTSEEYIGTGGQQLPFAAAEPEGSVQRAIRNNQTVATLVTAVNTGEVMIVSELRIRIMSTHPLASVQCISRGADIATVNSTSFQLAGK
ncbi:MAG: hypothetical protein MJE68_04145 [Proteobacteria bacterium]|nr:hypothetical protein [Pseudomonadota bacterium]